MKYENGTITNPVRCNEWSDVFDCARERNQPIIAECNGEIGKAFPSGRYEIIVDGDEMDNGQAE